jgi:hypothetical protein
MPAVVGRRAPKETEARPREPKTATVERREASVPRHGTQGASQAPGVSRHDTPHGCSAEHPNVSRRSAHPSIRVSEAKLQAPDAKNAPRERGWLFDIVRWELPKTVGRRAATSVILILRSAHAESSNAPQRTWAMEAPAFGFRCDAPQHDSQGRPHFGETNPIGEHARERRTNLGCTKLPPRNFIVSGLLFTMRFATHTGRPH